MRITSHMTSASPFPQHSIIRVFYTDIINESEGLPGRLILLLSTPALASTIRGLRWRCPMKAAGCCMPG